MSTSETTPESIRPGTLFCERYRIERRLDDGGMATIYLATDESDDSPVAIKVLFERYSDNDVVRARFLDEGRIQAMLDHPNIVHVHRIITDPMLCFVMEYVDGDTLDEYLQKNSPLDEGEIVDLLMPVMSAIGFAHNKGIVHRDLKPSNVLLESGGSYLDPKVMDFGVAKISRGKDLTVDGTTVGTLHYMSPEQIVGSSDIDGRADIYSLGCSLYKLCTGEVPFNASSEFALMMAHVEADPTPPSELRSDLSTRMEEIILRALKKKPDQRFQSIKAMTAELMELLRSDEDRDTITRPIPGHLLQFAMDADEVASDKTQEMRLETLIGAREDDSDSYESDVASQTHELSADALKKLEEDRLAAKNRHTKATRSLSKIETVERDRPGEGVDENAETTERDRRNPSESDTAEKKLDQLTTRPTTTTRNADLSTTKKQETVILDDNEESASPEAPKTIPMPQIEVPEEDDDATDRIRGEEYPFIDKTHVFDATNRDDVDSQEVTKVLRRDDLEVRGDDADLQRTVEHPMPDILQRGGGKSLKEAKITTKKARPVEEDDFESEATVVDRPKRRASVRPGEDDDTDTLEDRPSARLSAADGDPDRTSEERPSARRSAADEDSDPTVEERPSARSPASENRSVHDVEEREAVNLVSPRNADFRDDPSRRRLPPRRTSRSPERAKSPDEKSADRGPEDVNRARADRRPTAIPTDSPSNHSTSDGAPIQHVQKSDRHSTQSTDIKQKSSGIIWAIIGVAALLFAFTILAVVIVFL